MCEIINLLFLELIYIFNICRSLLLKFVIERLMVFDLKIMENLLFITFCNKCFIGLLVVFEIKNCVLIIIMVLAINFMFSILTCIFGKIL